MPIRTSAPAEHELVRIYNQSDRAFLHEIVLDDKDHTVIKYKLAGHTFGRVAPEVAALWLDWYKNEVVSADDAVAAVQGARKETEDYKAKLEAANKRIAELESQAAKPAAPRKGRDLI
jgi:hypothetical protein